MLPLESRGNRPLQMNFEHQHKSLVFFRLEEYTSRRHLLQVLKEDGFARNVIAPLRIKNSSFFEAINSRGLEQLLYVFQRLQANAAKVLPKERAELENLVAIDGSLINAVLSMHWADYPKDCNKIKVSIGFDMNQSIPSKIFLTDGKADERPFVSRILSSGQTGVMDRYYQCHKDFDLWQTEGKSFVCRIRENTKKTCIKANTVKPGGIVFYDAMVLLGTAGVNQTEKELRVIGYRIDNKVYWVATNRFDISAEEIATIYKLRWNIEIFFGWWKRHLKVYHLIARSEHGLLAQILGGLITYLLLAIYCYNHHKEKVSITRVRELRIKIQNEARNLDMDLPTPACHQADIHNLKEQQGRSFAIP
ncbi:MAG: IS4 family transposase [Candidatus Brocadia sapporoensis]